MGIPYQDYLKRNLEIKQYSIAALFTLATKKVIDGKAFLHLTDKEDVNKRFAEIYDQQIKNIESEEYKRINKQLSLEYNICFNVDNLTNYLADTLRFIFVRRPETLRSSDKIEVAEVLKHQSLDQFIESYAIKKADELTYGGIERMKKYLTDNLGLSLEIENKDELVLTRIISIRNVIVHNRGKVNERFIKETKSKEVKVGEHINIDLSDLNQCWTSFQRIAEVIYDSVSDKYGESIFVEKR